MKIYNGTPHSINVIKGSTFDPTIRKFIGGELVKSIPSNAVLNAKINTVEVNPIDDIPVFDKEITGYDPLPEGYDIYIVSVFYATAYKADNPEATAAGRGYSLDIRS